MRKIVCVFGQGPGNATICAACFCLNKIAHASRDFVPHMRPAAVGFLITGSVPSRVHCDRKTEFDSEVVTVVRRK